nr:MAG TPA: hypothetical protein [Caudoviricetes sp.]
MAAPGLRRPLRRSRDSMPPRGGERRKRWQSTA